MTTFILYLVLALVFAGWLVWLAHRETLEERGQRVRHPVRDAWRRWRERHPPHTGSRPVQ